MSSRLDRITNWPELAAQTNYKAEDLADKCGVKCRQLERYFHTKMKQSPHEWLRYVRQERAPELLLRLAMIKEVAFALGYRSAAHFSREFRSHFGVSPAQFRAHGERCRVSSTNVGFR